MARKLDIYSLYVKAVRVIIVVTASGAFCRLMGPLSSVYVDVETMFAQLRVLGVASERMCYLCRESAEVSRQTQAHYDNEASDNSIMGCWPHIMGCCLCPHSVTLSWWLFDYNNDHPVVFQSFVGFMYVNLYSIFTWSSMYITFFNLHRVKTYSLLFFQNNSK